MVRSNLLSIFNSGSTSDTLGFAEDFSKRLKAGDLILLVGEIGSGKTTFLNGVLKGLGSKRRILSSSFVLMSVYKAKRFNLIHFDFYRIKGRYDFLEIVEYLSGNNVVAIEWPYNIEPYIRFHPYVVRIYFIDENSRKIEVVKYE